MPNLCRMAPRRTQAIIVMAFRVMHETDLEHMNNGGRSGSSQWLIISENHGWNRGLEGLLNSKMAYSCFQLMWLKRDVFGSWARGRIMHLSQFNKTHRAKIHC